MSNANNGLLTKIWGPPSWENFHCVTFGYPVSPTEEQKVSYRKWAESIQDILPCRYCRDSYKFFLTDGYSELTDDDLKDRESFTKWGWRMHNRVNEKLGVDYGTSYEDIVIKYESYRAKCVSKDNGCTMPIDMKAKSYQKAEIKHAPIIDIEFCKKLAPYAKARGLLNYENQLKKFTNITSDNRLKRDKKCWALIKFMRKNSHDCTETKGEYEGLPTIYELALLSFRCGTITSHIIPEILERINKFNF